MSLTVVVLAAGQGTRMKSALPKVLHPLAGRPLLEHVTETATGLAPDKVIVVYGHAGDTLRSALAHLPVDWVEQAERLGTGHAVMQALPLIPPEHTVLVLYGDVPLISLTTLNRLLERQRRSGFAILTTELPDPTGYGRILRRADGGLLAIVEHKDASEAERSITEVNTGVMAVSASLLRRWLPGLDNGNSQGEYYLTDLVAMAVAEGIGVGSELSQDPIEVMGVNNRAQLAELERAFQRAQAGYLMAEGVTLHDPARFDLRGSLSTGRDVSIDVDVVIEGTVNLGDGVRIGPFCHIRDCTLGDGVEVLAHCTLDGVVAAAGARIGPYARLRPGTDLGEAAHIGNFVEVKNAQIGARSKVNHLSYIGDTEMGTGCNIGAGTITCNYDGAAKHQTIIGNDVFVGSDVQLVAPVKVGDGATIAAGTTVTEDAPAGLLTVGRSRQQLVHGWQRPKKT